MFVEIKNQRIPLHIGQWYLLGKQINCSESKANNFIKLDDGEDVEQKHCIINVGHSEEVFVFDLFSSKGTLVNNTPLKGSEMLRLKNGDILKVGNQEIKNIHDQQEMSHDSSGFLDDNKNTSDIIASSPDSTSQHESRVKRANYNNFLVPSIPPKKSVTPNTSLVIAESEADTNRNSLNSSSNSLNSNNRRSDSFTIPETQFCVPRSSLNASDLSVAESIPNVSGNKIIFNFGNLDDREDDDEDICIPETQELLPVAGITSSQRPRILSDGQFQDKSILLEESKNEAEDTKNIDGSQFRICTQDYNEGFGEEATQSEYSQIIPLIKHHTVILNNSAKSSNDNSRNQSKIEEDEKDMSALKWSNSKLDQETTALRADCSTPDILDFEELQQESNEKAAMKSNIEPPPNLLDEDDEDLLPTQVFLPSAPIKPTEKKSFIVPEKDCMEKENEEVLTLSDKENRCPVTLEPITDLPPTQLFATNEVSTARSTTSSSSCNSLPAPAVENKNNSKSLLNLDPDEEDDLLTQAFLQPSNLPSSSKHKNIPVKCFNSTVLEDKFMAKNPATFFAEMEKTPLKQNASPATNFKIPDKDFTVLRKPSSATSSTTESDVDLLMCTPQLIKEHIHMDKGEDMKKNILALFGDDTDDGESEEDDDQGDLVKLINIPKDYLDFDKLLPHLNKKTQKSKISEEATAAKEAQKLHKFNVFLGNEQDDKRTKSDHSRSTTLSRDERHMARDKERELTENKERTNKTKGNTSKGKKTKQTETTHQEDEQNSSYKSGKSKNDKLNISNKPEKNREDKQKISNEPGKSNVNEPNSSNKPNDERHMAKDNERELTDSKERTNKTKDNNTAKVKKTKHTETTHQEDEQNSSNKPGKNKEDEQSSSNKSGKNKEDEQKTSIKPEKSTRQRKRQASSDKQEKSKEAKKEEPVREMPARRMTRVKSKYEETASTSKEAASSKNSKRTQDQEDDLDSIATQQYEDDELDSVCTQPFVRVTRSRSSSKNSESQDSITTNNSVRKNVQQNKSKNDSSSSHNASVNGNMTTKTTGEQRKRKAEATPPAVPTKIERKRLRSTHSQDSSTTLNNSTSASSTISISMTMVDQELFKNLIQNSKGFWNIAKNPLDSDVLVMDKAFRTYKFLLAMARGIPIVTSEYLKKMNKSTTAKKVHIHDYLFADAEFEKKHKFSFVKSLQMAKKHKLFKDYEFLMTASILPNPQEIKTIIEVSGGYVHAKTPPAPKENQHIYLVTAKEDKKEWHKYRRLNKNIIIVSTEAIMSAVMRQTCERMTNYTLS